MKRQEFEKNFYSFLAERRIQYVLPWDRPADVNLFRAVGNTNKALFINLMKMFYMKQVDLVFGDPAVSFLGITQIYVAPEHRQAFDASPFPSLSVKQMGENQPQRKTMARIWHTAGFLERENKDGSLVFLFDFGTFQRMKSQVERADEKRRAKSKLAVEDDEDSSEASGAFDRLDNLAKTAMQDARPAAAGFLPSFSTLGVTFPCTQPKPGPSSASGMPTLVASWSPQSSDEPSRNDDVRAAKRVRLVKCIAKAEKVARAMEVAAREAIAALHAAVGATRLVLAELDDLVSSQD